jgi:hypothetical protein
MSLRCRAPGFIGETLKAIAEATDSNGSPDRAKEMYLASGIDLISLIEPMPKQVR